MRRWLWVILVIGCSAPPEKQRDAGVEPDVVEGCSSDTTEECTCPNGEEGLRHCGDAGAFGPCVCTMEKEDRCEAKHRADRYNAERRVPGEPPYNGCHICFEGACRCSGDDCILTGMWRESDGEVTYVSAAQFGVASCVDVPTYTPPSCGLEPPAVIEGAGGPAQCAIDADCAQHGTLSWCIGGICSEASCDDDDDCAGRPGFWGEPRCVESETRGRYCSECLTDDDCDFFCRNATRCEFYRSCTNNESCVRDPRDLMHEICVNGVCQPCTDDAECGDPELVCFDGNCLKPSRLDEACREGTCDGDCVLMTAEGVRFAYFCE